VFQRALDEYLRALPEEKKKRTFILNCQRSIKGPLTADAIFDSIKQAEAKESKKTAKRVLRSVLRPVVLVLNDYYAIVDSLGTSLLFLGGAYCSTDLRPQ
jgi:hypothetical protein